LNTTELLAKVRRLEIKTKGLSKHLFSGDYHSAFKGRGMSFSEVRAYQYGDDVRNIDWNVTARTQEPFVKQFEEERELTVMLMADVSGSVFFGSDGIKKNEWITELCAIIAFSASSNNDKVGLILFSDKIDLFIPPKKGRSHILRIIRELLNQEAQQARTDIGMALRYVNNVQKKRCICFLLSDFVSAEYDTPLQIAAKRHDLIGLCVYDKMEETLLPRGLIRGKDAETGKALMIDSNSDALGNRWKDVFTHHVRWTKNKLNKAGSDLLQLPTGEPYTSVLHQFFKKRAARK
jgi:uncharacterized protein (DUF58 family)